MKSLFGGSAVIAATILSGAFILSAIPSAAEPISSLQLQKQEPGQSGRSETRERVVGTKSEGKSEGTNPIGSNPADTTGAADPGMMSGVVTEATDPAGGLTSAVDLISVP